ncbi:hypothetical protein C723_2851 [Christiangramia flava JLT2011]|uniref:Uncharacterized protein n=1 Tax=Christiangramia flava JLT2011 TaxID=1229726 RepID=A0A1L7I4V9_9FLAO|nr:hypothetical protein GRFL_1902 [Christiangramia flava JLT2011]OSS38150.1 hypothetical protein C723_2851 [Christiangramia flava JLT2011]
MCVVFLTNVTKSFLGSNLFIGAILLPKNIIFLPGLQWRETG